MATPTVKELREIIALWKCLRERAKRRAMKLSDYIRQLDEADELSERQKRFLAAPIPADAPADKLNVPQQFNRRTKIDGLKRQRILFLLDEGLSVRDVAKSLGIGGSTVSRVKLERERCAVHTPYHIQPAVRRGSAFGGSGL